MITLETLTPRLETIVAVKPAGETEWQWFTRNHADRDEIIRARSAGLVVTVTRRRGGLVQEIQRLAEHAERIAGTVRRLQPALAVVDEMRRAAMGIDEMIRLGEQAKALGLDEIAQRCADLARVEQASQGFVLLAARVEGPVVVEDKPPPGLTVWGRDNRYGRERKAG